MLALNRGSGSEVFHVDRDGPKLVERCRATPEADGALSRAAELTVERLAARGPLGSDRGTSPGSGIAVNKMAVHVARTTRLGGSRASRGARSRVADRRRSRSDRAGLTREARSLLQASSELAIVPEATHPGLAVFPWRNLSRPDTFTLAR